MTIDSPAPPDTVDPDPVAEPAAPPASGPGMGTGRVVVLLLAVAFLASALTWSIVTVRDRDPLSSTDVGYMQDMGVHHEQAVQMSLLLLGKPDVDSDLKSFAQEIIIDQRFEQGVFNATLDRYGHPTDPGPTAMAWMNEPVPVNQMAGLATPAQMAELRAAKGRTAEALWIALMSNHHLGGLHMADWEARHGKDTATRNLALATVRNQRSDVVDFNAYRLRHHLPIPPGFSDPMKDQRLNPISFTQGN